MLGSNTAKKHTERLTMKKTITNAVQVIAFIGLSVGLILFSEESTTETVAIGTTKNSAVVRERGADRESIQVEREVLSEEAMDALAYHGYQRELAYPGFTTYPESGSGNVFLVNMSGDVVHEWKFDASRLRLLPNCHVLVVHGTKWGMKRSPWKELRYSLREYDFDGNLVWEFKSPDYFHHDVQLLENGNVLGLRRIEIPAQRMLAVKNPLYRGLRMRSDEIVEISREQNDIVWSWKAHHWMDPNNCGKYPCPKPIKREQQRLRQFDWTHTNTVSPIPENKWYAEGDTRFKPGNLIVMPRNHSTVIIVDKESKEIVWRYKGNYEGGLSYGHEPHMITPGLPGAGNMLIFDNGQRRNSSAVLEINPVTKELVWAYDMGNRFVSKVAGSMQRLPNGNTLISEDTTGRVFEVTPEKQIVWEYKGNQIRSARAHRYTPDYCERLKDFPVH